MSRGLIAVLVLVAGLFVVAVVVGFNSGSWSADPEDNRWVETFQFRPGPAVEVADIGPAGCFSQAPGRVRIDAGDRCRLRIRAAEEEIRLLTLEARQPEGGLPALVVNLDPESGDDVKIDDHKPDVEDFPLEIPVGARGAQLTIDCENAETECVLQLAE